LTASGCIAGDAAEDKAIWSQLPRTFPSSTQYSSGILTKKQARTGTKGLSELTSVSVVPTIANVTVEDLL
jgi:hypothetical protein